MNKLLLTTAMVALISTGAMAQSTVVTTTGTGHTAAVQIEPEYRTKIRTFVTEHKVRPVETREKIVVGQPVPREVELEAVPADWGPSLTKYRYVYSGERVMLVDPSTRTVVQEID
ncbi:sugar (pentulose or hexulose) kinase [Bradyrhizobium sp. USDA 4472]